MPRRIRCPSCRNILLFDEEDRGAKVCCPECEKWLVVPDAAFRPKGASDRPRSPAPPEADDRRPPAKSARARAEESKPARRSRVDEDDDYPEDRPSRRRRPPTIAKARWGPWMWVGVSVSGVVALGAVV